MWKGENSYFGFETVTKEKIEEPVTNLDIRKAAKFNDIPTKEFGYLFFIYIATSINRYIAKGTFAHTFKRLKFNQNRKRQNSRKVGLQTH